MATSTDEADQLADNLPTGGNPEDQIWSMVGQVMTKRSCQGSRATGGQDIGAWAPKDVIKKQLLAKIHNAAGKACQAELTAAPPEPRPPAAPPESAPAMPRYFDISQGDAPLSVSES